MTLYYCHDNKKFVLNSDGFCEPLFTTHNREGKAKGHDEFVIGKYRIVIETNFYPKNKSREYIRVNIYVNGIQLLPISLACRLADVNYHFSEHEISFVEFGTGNNKGIPPFTIVQCNPNIDWDILLQMICTICNDYEQWVIEQTLLLEEELENHQMHSFVHIATFIRIVRKYDQLIPNFNDVYTPFLNKYCFSAMKNLLDYVSSTKACEILCKRDDGDYIWAYIKDFWLTNRKSL